MGKRNRQGSQIKEINEKVRKEVSREMSDPFIIQVEEKEMKKEREKARELRKTRWWKNKLAQGICYYCRRRFPPSELTMDHIVPLIRGGISSRGNVAAVCRECNYKKKYLLPMEWRDFMQNLEKDEKKNG